MTESQPRVRIHIFTPEDEDEDDLTDLGLVNVGGERLLFLKPQSFDSAVRQVRSALPDLPLEQVERLLREHQEFKDFEELLGTAKSVSPLDITPMLDEPRLPGRLRGRTKRWVIAAALAPALAGSWALGYFSAGSPAGTSASVPDKSPSPSATDASAVRPAAKPFVGPEFMDFSKAGQIDCKPIANLEAECTDADGMVMSSKAAIGPDSTIFTFSYGSEQIGLRIFGDATYAETWARQDGTTELYPNLTRSGRYVLWGTDKKRLSEYTELLQAANASSSTRPHMMRSAAPLPPRLAALTLGTLGLGEGDVATILHSPRSAPLAEPVLLAAQAVLGVQTTVPRFTGGDDIVAIAAGLDRPPVVSPAEHTTDMDPPTVPIVPRGTQPTPIENTEGTQPTTSTPAPAEEPTAEGPQAEQPTSTPAPVESTAPEQSTPPATSAPEPSTPPASDPVEETTAVPEPTAVDETQTDEGSGPVEETPAAPESPALSDEGSALVEETPAPVDLPVDTAAPTEEPSPADPSTGQSVDDLLILDSAWTVATA
ncbi:hypothetical protein IM697_18030 [Streptomyces ferrugineus]|uniref:Uncharacterized protein n=1 Tax=Streptomyces ferrugineus TaxID=1413221 RepID=A0A7M2SX99_9ACTN|nr:hypothetical protein [Streptomyces ferrugineus]QOV40128.1 hypothetical protein IM697_18030 [Streptomyces ferrugineus]